MGTAGVSTVAGGRFERQISTADSVASGEQNIDVPPKSNLSFVFWFMLFGRVISPLQAVNHDPHR